MATKPTTPSAAGVNAAQADNPATESDQDISSSISDPDTGGAFDVEEWLVRFEAVGGFLTPGSLGWHIYNRTDEEHAAAREIYREIEHSPERLQMVRDFSRTPEQIERYYRSFDREA